MGLFESEDKKDEELQLTPRLEPDCPQRYTATGQEVTGTSYSRDNANKV